MTDPFYNVRCFLPRADASKLLTILQQIDLWKETHDQEPAKTAGESRADAEASRTGIPGR